MYTAGYSDVAEKFVGHEVPVKHCYECRELKFWWAFRFNNQPSERSGKCRVCLGESTGARMRMARETIPDWVEEDRKSLIAALTNRMKRMAAYFRRQRAAVVEARDRERERWAAELEERRVQRREYRALAKEDRLRIQEERRVQRKDAREAEKQHEQNLLRERRYELYQAPQFGVRSLDAPLNGFDDFTLADTVPSHMDVERETVSAANVQAMFEWAYQSLTDDEMNVLNAFLDCDLDLAQTAQMIAQEPNFVEAALSSIRNKSSSLALCG